MSVSNPQQQPHLHHQYHNHQHPQQQQHHQQQQQAQQQQTLHQQQQQHQLQQQLQQQIEQELVMEEDLKRRLEKLARNYDIETMKVFMVVEAVGERSLHAVYNPQAKVKVRWQSFLQRLEACRLDLVKHEKTRERYKQFLREVAREDQGRQWFLAVLRLLRRLGAADVFDYVNNHTSISSQHSHSNHNHHHSYHHHHHFGNNNSNSKAVVPHRSDPRRHSYDSKESYRRQLADMIPPGQDFLHPHHSLPLYNKGQHSYRSGKVTMERELTADTAAAIGVKNGGFCDLLAWLFEKKIESWFDSFEAVAVNLTAHVKVSGLVRVLSGKVHALCTRQGRLHALAVKVTAQDTPRPLDVAELCLAKVMIIQNGLALPEDLGLAMLVLHTHPARPVLRLWQLTPSAEMETAIRLADIDEMIDGGRMSQYHELWTDNTITDLSTTTTTTATATDPAAVGVDAVGPGPVKNAAGGGGGAGGAAATNNGGADYNTPDKNHLAFMAAKSSVAAQPTMPTIGENPSVVDDGGSPLNF